MTTAERVHASSSRPTSALAAALAGSRIVPFDALRAYPLDAASDAHAQGGTQRDAGAASGRVAA